MKRSGNASLVIALVWALVLLGAGRAAEVVEQGDELIVNSGLEGEYVSRGGSAFPPGWRGNIFGQAKGRYIEETEDPHSGRSAIKIECDALPVGGISFYQTDRVIRYAPGRKYTLSAWIRSDTDAEMVSVSIRDCEQVRKVIRATRGWRKYTIGRTYTGASGEDFVALYYLATRPGNVVFDDITLRVVDDEAGARSMSRNLLPNAGLTVAKSGFAPDWWNWYGGTDRDDWPDCWQPVDDHYIPDTRSIKLTDSARLQTSYLRRMKLAKGTAFTLSAYLRSATPDTKVQMHLGGWTGINKVTEVTVGTEWKRCHVTGTPEKDVARPFMYICLEGSGPLWVNAPQLEQGDAPTEWRLSEKDEQQERSASEGAPREDLLIPRIECPVAEEGPVIDGVAADAAWEQAATTDTFRTLTRTDQGGELGADAHPATDARICRDGEKLYIAFRCAEPLSRLVARERQRDDYGILGDDCVEVFISRKADGSDYVHLAANARGSRYDADGYERTFDAEWDCKARSRKGAWSVEFAIPFSSLGARPGAPLRINLARYRAQRGGEEQYSCLAPVHGSFHDSERFCVLGADGENFPEEAPDVGLKGELVAYLDRSFYTTEAHARVFVDVPRGTSVRLKMGDRERQEALPASRLIAIDLASLTAGEYPIEVSVGERQLALVLAKLPPKDNAVKIDRIHRVPLVDGKPFVPFGILGGIPEAEWKAWRKHRRGDRPRMKGLRLQADLGFNCAVYMLHQPHMTAEAEEKLRVMLDAAQALGMKLIVYYKSYDFHEDRSKWDAELLDVVGKFKDHPAILAWLVYDEPPITKVKWLEGLCDSVNEADPYHPVFINWCDRGHGWTREMTGVSGDICMLDGYYINAYDVTTREAFLTIGGHCAEMTAHAKREGKLVGYWNGLHGWASAIREHSPAEQRFVTYVSLIRGAKVFLYFGGPFTMNVALRESFAPLAREMAALTSVVAGPEVKDKVTCDNPRIDYTAFQAKDGLYVVALNTDENKETATFHVEGAKGEALVLFEDRTQRIVDGALNDDFSPLERHVYQVKGLSSK